ncbi:MAG TPA: DUF3027 domain-containing protein [Marmoricola sp.]|nr:DUF3027 domain-containing protein [Marmoricola sp.]
MLDIAADAPALVAARACLAEAVGKDAVGEFQGASNEQALGLEVVATYHFENVQPGYRGWAWAITVIVLPDAEPTIAELVLLPGETAILAPAWVPWRERIRPGDLTPGDILPVDEDDPRLVPGYFAGDDQEPPVDRQSAQALTDEVGLGRPRVLSVDGRDMAAQRWYEGASGPAAPVAKAAPGRCGNCGFLVRLSGPLSTMFGVCANAYANDDARVVSFDHGCGAHSQAQLRRKQLPPPLADHALDTLSRDEFDLF